MARDGIEPLDLMKCSFFIRAALGDKEMQMRMMIDSFAKGLDGGDDAGAKLLTCHGLKVIQESPHRSMAEFAEELAFVLEEEPQHPGDGEDDLMVGGHPEGVSLAPTLPERCTQTGRPTPQGAWYERRDRSPGYCRKR